MSDFDDMYVDDEETPRNAMPVKSTLGNFSVNGAKSSYVHINGEMVEVVNKGYVESLEAQLRDTKRDLRSAQTKIAQLTRFANSLSADIGELRRQLNARGRFD